MLEVLVLPSDADPALVEAAPGVGAVPAISMVGADLLHESVSYTSTKGKVGVALTRVDRPAAPSKTVRVSAIRFSSTTDAKQALDLVRSSWGSKPVATIPNLTDGVAAEVDLGKVDVLLEWWRLVRRIE
ncbi:hypothetical protein HNP11_003377 [Tsukamurella ocularis]|uniref:DUF7373 family lipoprotein n=1 Tax=Tsukamurella ocularis TaxID=1970234 RepID=UPI0021683ECF|nr:hypothetical protein [Tsukamurella ocularis]MCS3778483.1 hypothetical protein [Tsukamurella ocularis]MCS3789185.1 hypothetical protein [Tsukamurella ocularis]MCS3853035.1 hypothetical protein [Tsukamurella ocularis]